jgi:anti-anti-sigma regulatory factor
MLRITTCDTSGVTRLMLEGKLAGACVGELERCWRETTSARSTASILVDLSGITFVDVAGKQLLAEMHGRGARFAATGLLANCLIEEIECSGGTHG